MLARSQLHGLRHLWAVLLVTAVRPWTCVFVSHKQLFFFFFPTWSLVLVGTSKLLLEGPLFRGLLPLGEAQKAASSGWADDCKASLPAGSRGPAPGARRGTGVQAGFQIPAPSQALLCSEQPAQTCGAALPGSCLYAGGFIPVPSFPWLEVVFPVM